MPTITIRPNSKSEIIDLTDVNELKIEKIEEYIIGSIQLPTHYIEFFTDSKESSKFKLLLQETYNVSNYVKAQIENKNPKKEILITYNIVNDEINRNNDNGFHKE